jgi:hypothetical protein
MTLECPVLFSALDQFPCPSWRTLHASCAVCACPLTAWQVSQTSCHCQKLDLLDFLIVNENTYSLTPELV